MLMSSELISELLNTASRYDDDRTAIHDLVIAISTHFFEIFVEKNLKEILISIYE